MKSRLIALFSVFVIGVAACGACTKKPQAQPTEPDKNACTDGGCPLPAPAPSVTASAPTPPTNVPDVIAEDNWQFTLTGPGWVPVTPPVSTIKVAMKNEDQQMMVILVKEQTSSTYAAYVVEALRDLRGAHLDIVSANQVTLNGNNFVVITAKGGNKTIYSWVTTKDGYGYVFSCGGITNVDAGSGPCEDIAATLQIR